MWDYIRLSRNDSPMNEIISQCSGKSNLRLAVYNLSENHVECATVSADEVRKFALGSVAREILRDAEGGSHAILAYDLGLDNVYLVDSVPELPVASAVLLCVVTELLNGCVQPRQTQCGAPRPNIEQVAENNYRAMNEVVRRDERGRFVRSNDVDEPWRNIPTQANANEVMAHRFRLGIH